MNIVNKYSVNDIKTANHEAGYHFFDPDTMRCFGSRIERTVYQGEGGVYFISSEDDFNRTRRFYCVRQFMPETGQIETMSGINENLDLEEAIEKAKTLAGKGVTTKTESYKPITVLGQFLADLRKHGSPEATEEDAKRLMKLAAKHHKYMEKFCNGEIECDEEGEFPAYVRTCKAEIAVLAMDVGAKGVVLSGDPRGATVKLTFADGHTDDWGKEGYCVPTGENE